MSDAEALDTLRGLDLFTGAQEADLVELAALSTPRRLSRGQILFVHGEASTHLYVVLSGRLKVLVSSPRGDDLVLAVLEKGDALGELSILDDQPRSATAEALEPTLLLAVPAEAVRAYLRLSPDSLMAWAQSLAATLRRLTGSAADLVFLDLPRRLAKLLLEHADARGEVELKLSQSEIAALLGVTRQSLNRALGGLSRRGWVAVRGSAVLIRDQDALARFASS